MSELMTAARILYTRFHTIQDFIGFCTECQNTIAGQSYSLGIDVWQDGVLTRSRTIRGFENICFPCFNLVKGAFPEQKAQ